MSEPTPRFCEIFFELYEGLPRQGPGNRRCAEKALDPCCNLPQAPAVLDRRAQESGAAKYSDYYAYEFLVICCNGGASLRPAGPSDSECRS